MPLTVTAELPKVLRDFSKAAKREKLKSLHDFQVFGARYFAQLAHYHVEVFLPRQRLDHSYDNIKVLDKNG